MSAASVRRLRGALVAIAEAGWVAVVYAALDGGGGFFSVGSIAWTAARGLAERARPSRW